MNVGEYGITIRVGVGEDISSATNSIVLKDPGGRRTRYAAVLGTVAVDEDGVSYNPNEYAYYITTQGDIDAYGTWAARLETLQAGILRKSDWIPFTVER